MDIDTLCAPCGNSGVVYHWQWPNPAQADGNVRLLIGVELSIEISMLFPSDWPKNAADVPMDMIQHTVLISHILTLKVECHICCCICIFTKGLRIIVPA